MSGIEKPKRRFWQLHLSTIIVTTMAAGGILGLNFTGWLDFSNYQVVTNTKELRMKSGELVHRGDQYERTNIDYGFPYRCLTIVFITFGTFKERREYWHFDNLLINGMLGFGILVAFALACEHRIRRREDRKL